MKAVVQRVKTSSVSVNGKFIGAIGKGLNVLLAVKNDDDKSDADFLIKKIMQLRIFEDEEYKMNLSIQDVNGEMLIISQFTLYGDCKKGNRPSYSKSASAEKARELYEYFIKTIKSKYSNKVECGEFQADMLVDIRNDGPVTLIVESKVKNEKT